MARIVHLRVEVEGVWHEQDVVLSGQDLAPWPAGTAPLPSPAGEARPRVDGLARASGRATFTADLALPGLLHCRILRAPHAHARLISLDVSAARKLPGVAHVLCRDNAPRLAWYNDRSSLFDDHIRFEGEEVAAVAAVDPDTAQDALERIEARYQPLAPLLDPEAALAPGAVALFEDGNAAGRGEPYLRGDVALGFRQAEATVEVELRTPGALHNALETHGSVAWWTPEKLTVWDSTQNIHGIRAALAARLELPLGQVRVLSPFVGGGFGAKNGLRKYTVIAALLSRATGRPVRAMLDREEENLAAGNRAPAVVRVRLGAKADGRLSAIQLTSHAAVGAYGNGSMPIGGPARTLYACANVMTREHAARTTTGPHAAFRAPGYVEGSAALESAMDELSRKLGIDPLTLRRRNLPRLDPASGLPYTSSGASGLEECLKRAMGMLGTRRLGQEQGDRRRGVGLACALWGAGGGPPAYATVKLDADGSATVITGTQDIGTGVKTVLAQIAAAELSLPLERVTVYLGDTDLGLWAPLSAGSMTLVSVGPAVRMAAADARGKLLAVLGARLGVAPDQLQLELGRVRRRGDPGPGQPIAEVTRGIAEFTLLGQGERHPDPEGEVSKSFAAHAAEVEVDTGTGEVKVLRYVAVHDVGRVLNPMTASSQVAGGVLMGLGYALMEERAIDPRSGRALNPNLADYRVPTAADLPELQIAFLEGGDRGGNNLGARGLGEPPILPVAPALLNAVRDAIGVRLDALPMTPARVLAALGKAPRLRSETELAPPVPR